MADRTFAPRTSMRLLRRAALASLALTGAASAQSTPPPVYREPRHHLVYDRPLVRIMDLRVPVGDTTLFHVHADRYVGVVIDAARTWEQFQGATPAARPPRAAGAIFDNLKSTLPYTHRVGNADTLPFRFVVSLVRAPSRIDAPALDAASGLRLDYESELARGYHVTLAPGQATNEHRHAQPGITVQVSAGALRLDGAPAEGASATHGAGAWWWRGAGASHRLRNVGTTPVEVVEIDWK